LAHIGTMSDRTDIGATELERRVIFSLLLPAARCAATFGIPIKELTNFIQLAYFRQLRSQGATLREAGESMDVSTRSAKRLAQRLRETFFAPEVEHELPRRIEFVLWAQPMSRARLLQTVDVDEDELDRALAHLVREERVRLEDGRTPTYHATRPVTRLAMREDWVSRIGSLNSLMENVSNTVFGRFFGRNDASFARTISFRLRDEDVAELRRFYEEHLIPKLTELEQNAHSDPQTTKMQLSLLWAPYADAHSPGEEDE